MNKDELYSMLCCPETKQDVSEMSKDDVKKINNAIKSGNIKTVAGKDVKEYIDSALIRDDKKVAYPIRNNIPIMLIHEGFDPSQAM